MTGGIVYFLVPVRDTDNTASRLRLLDSTQPRAREGLYRTQGGSRSGSARALHRNALRKLLASLEASAGASNT
jgi:hypothetical protein